MFTIFGDLVLNYIQINFGKCIHSFGPPTKKASKRKFFFKSSYYEANFINP